MGSSTESSARPFSVLLVQNRLARPLPESSRPEKHLTGSSAPCFPKPLCLSGAIPLDPLDPFPISEMRKPSPKMSKNPTPRH